MSTELDTTPSPWGPRPEVGPSASVPLVLPPVSVDFRGERRPFARMMLAGYALYLPSFGFNRFWLKTDERRFFWLNTTLDGDSFEYRGTARELVIGFLFAVAIYMPVAALYSIAGLYAETVQTYASLPFFIFTFAFGHYAAFRARRYRLTRTAFRGIRFWMSGSGWRMGAAAFGWLLLTAVTMGLAYFWMQAWLERYKMAHARFGDIPGRFEGTGWGLLKAFFWPAFTIFGTVITFLVFGGGILTGLLTGAGSLGVVLGGAIFASLLLILLGAVWSVVSVVKTRWWLNGVRFGGVRVNCAVGAGVMVKPAMRTALLVIVTLVLWYALGGLLAGVLGLFVGRGFDSNLLTDIWVLLPLMAWTMAGLVMAMALKSILYNYDFVAKIAAATTITGLESLALASSQGTAEGAVGEGLADALGADGF